MKVKNCTISFFRIVLLLMLCTCIWSSHAFAKGKAIIKPHVEAGWQRDSNFHKSETNTKTVDTWFVKPGIEMGYTTDKSRVSLDYWFNSYTYDDQDDIQPGDLDADDFDYVEHYANLLGQIQPSDRVLLGLDNLFLKTRDPANADENSNAVDRFKYNLNKFSPWVNYRLAEKFGLQVRYTNQVLDYQDDEPGEGEDSDENRGAVTLFYYFNPRISFDLDYQLWNRDYDQTTTDYDSHQLMVNVNRQFKYFTFTAGIGYHDRDFDESVPSGDIDTVAWKLSVYGQNPPPGTGKPRSSMLIGLSSNLNDVGTGESYYNATRLDVVLTRLFMEKLNCTLNFWYTNSDYETSDREDDRWLISGAVDYLVKDYFTVGLEAGYEERDSNETGKDFDNDYIMFKVAINYDMGSR